MKKDDLLEVEITAVGMNGEGIARVDGMVIFIPLCLVGEVVKVQIIQVKKAWARARVIKVIQASEDRVTPLCPIFFRCGSCEMQHINYAKQLEIKALKVKNCIDKECGIDCKVDATVGCLQEFGYRNKVQIPFTIQEEKIVAGYYAEASHRVIPFPKNKIASYGNCPLHNQDIQQIIDIFLVWANKERLSIYQENIHKGILRHLCIRQIGDSFAIVVVANCKNIKGLEILANSFVKNNIKFSLYFSSNMERTNVIMGKTTQLIYGQEKIETQILDIKCAVSPLSFMQVNDEIRDKIYQKTCAIIAQYSNTNVIDLYSGIGILSNIFAQSAKRVYGVEIVPDAIKDANILAEKNGNKDKIINICGDAQQVLPKVVKMIDGASVAVIDPPRKGCDIGVLNTLNEVAPDSIVYISCNPATLARDLKVLLEKYELESITPYDMFPQTSHVETVVSLKRK